jgi:hypothetical protein
LTGIGHNRVTRCLINTTNPITRHNIADVMHLPYFVDGKPIIHFDSFAKLAVALSGSPTPLSAS